MTPDRMLIAVEATRLQREMRGIGRYVRAILPRLVSQRPGLHLMLFAKTRRGVVALAESVARDPRLRDHVSVRHVREMARTPADLYWYPWNVVAPVPRSGASVVTVHDIAPVAMPDPRWLSWRKNLRWRFRFRRTARVATLIVADSAFTASEIQRVLGVGADRIRVVLLAADDFAVPSSTGDADALERLGVRAPFVLSVGAAERRKNYAVLERAMPSVVEANRGATLVLAGPRRRSSASSPDAPWMKTLGFVSDADLAVLYRNAAALVMPSSYEGFGLPVLEAMGLGTPVICARAASLPEVAGDAALWVKPDDAADLASAITRVLGDESLRDRLHAGSLRQSGAFSWDDTARRTLKAFDEACEMHARAHLAELTEPLEPAHASL
jgi:glycosyltransferase involved in cell wall biosynthesis